MLKVMCDPDLFYSELDVFRRIETLTIGAEESGKEKMALRLINYFQFQTPMYELVDMTSS